MSISSKAVESMTRDEERAFICRCNADITARLRDLTANRHSIELSLELIMEEPPKFVNSNLKDALYTECIGKLFKMDKNFIIENLRDLI